MKEKEFSILAKAMKAIYPDPKFLPDELAFKTWYALLKDLDYQVASDAVQRYMMTETRIPTPADIRSKVRLNTMRHEDDLSPLEAWHLVYKAICNSNYNADAEFDKLPSACQIAVGSPANLREWAMMDQETVESVEQSHFIRAYRHAVERQKDESQISLQLLEKIALHKSDKELLPNRVKYSEITDKSLNSDRRIDRGDL